MTDTYQKLQACYQSFSEKIHFLPAVALVLGSGLGDFADSIQMEATLDYREIENFPVSTVSGHRGRFVFGYIGGTPVVIMQGRVHYYEGYSMEDVVLPIRLMRLMGAETLILTNAAGGIGAGFHAGDFMLITDQISSFVPSPLIGPNMDELGTRFPDMTHIYDADLCRIARETAASLGITLQEGVYLQMSGPAYESPAEVRMCRAVGADAVGMSTACEAVAARHMGMRICGISCISNLASGLTDKPLSHEEVKEASDRMAPRFAALLTGMVSRIGGQ
ncbi:MAG: purine-nucleoside phosphorylase [Clostridiales bacterium]|nr:purine-nucleoside phosphorylase [Clostridiales bacterium]MCD8223832.1 purine-nucleoside phosphorylase [Clostridiales bacterium]